MKSRVIHSTVVGIASVCIGIAIAGCGGDSSTESAAAKAVVADSIPQASDPSLQIEAAALTAEAKKRGMSVIRADANLDLNKQISDIETFIQKKVDAIVVWPMDSKGIEPAFARAADAGIPVIARQTPTNGSYYVNLQSDDYLSGVQAAEYMAKTLGKGARVAAIIGPQQVDSFRDLAEGFAKGAKDRGLDVVDTQTNQDLTPEASATFARNWRQQYGSNLQGIFDSLDATALAVTAVRDSNFDPIIVTYGGSDEALEAVRIGKFAALMYQYAVVIGRASGWAAAKAVNGEKLPKTIYLPQPLINKQNVGEYPPSSKQLTKGMTFSIRKEGSKAYLEFSNEP